MCAPRLHSLALAAALACGVAAAPNYAAAQDDLGLSGVGLIMMGAGGSVLFGVPLLVLGSADIYYGAQDRLLPLGWAIAQLIHGASFLAMGAGMFAWVAAGDGAPMAVAGVVTTLVGGWFVGHSIWSFTDSGGPSDPDPDVAFVPLIQPRRDGLTVGVAGAF